MEDLEAFKRGARLERLAKLEKAQAQLEREEKKAPALALVRSLDEARAVRAAERESKYGRRMGGKRGVGRELEEMLAAVNQLDDRDVRDLKGVKMAHDAEMAALKGKKKKEAGIFTDEVLEADPYINHFMTLHKPIYRYDPCI